MREGYATYAKFEFADSAHTWDKQDSAAWSGQFAARMEDLVLS